MIFSEVVKSWLYSVCRGKRKYLGVFFKYNYPDYSQNMEYAMCYIEWWINKKHDFPKHLVRLTVLIYTR